MIFTISRVLFVADESVDPEVGDVNVKGVGAGMECLADFYLKRFVPEGAEWFFVQSHFRNHGDITQVQPDLLILFKISVRQIELHGVGGGAGEITDAGVAVFVPGQ